ncbi:DNA-methyltransferase [Lysinibacillus capsici]|uniref:DNA-methyltransferase n=1 Tax=Lysinibacillus capsici TaxID=2115968 RepID=UPI000E200CA4|nr:site-specific DNA-methyltransferase [Lysinibacillus capsici]RDV26272.1 site-specific DNA-methyltransferase [Lysinibacillus capsici]
MQEFLNRVIHGDCSEIMAYMPSNCVDLTITSPPYDDLRNYNGYSFPFEEIAKQLFRITKDGGVVVWVVGDSHDKKGSETLTSFKQAIHFKNIGFNVHDTMIYQKNSYPFPPSNRYYQQFEYMFVLSKGKPKTSNLLRQATKWQKSTGEVSTTRQKNGTTKEMKYEKGKKDRVRDNVWPLNTGYMRTTKDKFAYEHPAMFPEQLAQDHILTWSNEGDVVFDPMCGAGTTLKMAYLNNRNFFGIDTSIEYVELSQKRLQGTGYYK